MKIKTLNTQTGEIEIIDVGDIHLESAPPVIEPVDIDADVELTNAINSATTIAGLKSALLGKNGLAKVKGMLK